MWNWQLQKPRETFCTMLGIPELTPRYTANSSLLLSEYGTGSVDGTSYGESTENYVRLSLAKDTDVLMQVTQRLIDGIN